MKEEADAQASYQHDRDRIDDAKNHPGRTLLYLALFALGPALAVHAPRLVLLRPRARHRLRPRVRAGAAHRHRAGARPAAPAPVDTTWARQEFTATLFDLIRRGRYKSSPVNTEKKLWGGLRHETVSDLLVTPGDESVPLADFEEPVAGGDRLGRGRRRRAAERVPREDREAPLLERDALHQLQVQSRPAAIKARKWFTDAGAGLLGLGLAACVVAAVVLLWIGIDGWRPGTPRWSDVVLVAIGGCAIVNAVVLVLALTRARLWRRRTKAGQTEAERWDAFRRYLTDFPRLQEAPPGDARALGALPGLRDRVRDRRAGAPGRAAAHAAGAARPELDLLDHPVRRPRLRRDVTRDRRPVARASARRSPRPPPRARAAASPAAAAAAAEAAEAAPGRAGDHGSPPRPILCWRAHADIVQVRRS